MRDLLKKRVIYLFIHSTASGCRKPSVCVCVLAFLYTSEMFFSQDILALAECTVLSLLRDSPNFFDDTNVLRLSPVCSVALTLIQSLHVESNLKMVFQDGDHRTACKIVSPFVRSARIPHVLFYFVLAYLKDVC